MGANYTRQSTYTDGDTISAADTNDEFDQLLAAFAANTGHTHDGTTGEGGPITTLATNTVTFGTGADTDISVTFDANSNDGVITWMEDEDYFQFSDEILMTTTEKILFRDTALSISSSTDGQLDIDADTEVEITAPLVEMSADATVGDDFTLKSDAAVLGFGADTDTTLTHVADTGLLLNSTRQLQFGDSGTYIHQSADGVLDLVSDTEIEINATTIDVNGAIDVSGASTLTGNVTLGGQLRMPDNTASKLLIADGTSFEEKAVGDLSEISTVANDDVFLAVDTSGGGLKKIQRSAIVAGLATSGAISNVAEDSTPQLGGNLDMNGNDIVTTSNADIDLAPNGTGKVVVKGNTNPGTVVFNCESNSHGQTVKSQPHSASVTNVLTLPPGGDQEIVGTTATQTLTNKTIDASQLSGTVANARLDAQLQDVAGLAVTDGGFIVGNGSNFVLETGATVRSSLGLAASATTDTTNASNIGSGTLAAARMAAAQTAITSILATDVKIGEDNETKIDFETADEIHFYAANAEQVFVSDGVFGPQTDSDVDLGTTGARFKDAYIDSATITGDVAVGDDITVAGRAVGTMTTDNDGSFDLSVSNDFKCTPSGNFTLTFTNGDEGQSGNIILINSGGHTVSAHADIAINATTLTALSTAGTYHLAYFCSADSGTANTIAVSASGALT
tara:strand:- start:3308 stop:5341 length:2034 start_codon:yes stop_codon:yes gene_type:complete